MKLLWQFSLIILFAITLSAQPTQAAQDLPPCGQRPHLIDPPWVNANYYCAELVIHDESGGEMGFTSLVAAPDGTLYATRPLSGEVFALIDTDQDGLPDAPHVVAKELTLPNGLAYFDGALYISGGTHVYKLVNEEVTTLINDLPSGAGFWTGGISVGSDRRIYVGIGAACDSCQQTEADRGVILSFALDGNDRKVISTGLRQPSDLAFKDNTLWVTDTSRDNLPYTTNYDELNRVVAGNNFGWPHCIGMNELDKSMGDFDCQQSTVPALLFPTHSNPLGMVAYSGNAFPQLEGQLLITMGGNHNEAYLNGYTLVTVGFDGEGKPLEPHVILPELPSGHPLWAFINLQKIHYQASGFWQHHPYDVTVSREGWIYISLGGGTIWALRPR